MEILGIGPSELILIVVIAIIVLGPRDMQKAGRTIGKWLRQVVTSDGWKLFQQTSREIQTLPNRLMREAALDELKDMERDLRQPIGNIGRAVPESSQSPRTQDPTPSTEGKPVVLPTPQEPGSPQASEEVDD